MVPGSWAGVALSSVVLAGPVCEGWRGSASAGLLLPQGAPWNWGAVPSSLVASTFLGWSEVSFPGLVGHKG